MGAGDGAAEQSRLAAERVARLKRRLDEAERGTKPWDAVADGAAVVAEKLGELVPKGWYVLNDVHWPGRPAASLDHVLVGPGGVVVVDSKNWTGEVRVASGVLWQGRYARTQAVEGALAQCAAVTSVVAPPHRRLVRPLICMAAQPDLFGVTNSDVAVAGAQRVVGAIEALPAVLDQQAVVELYEHLGRELTREQEPGITALRSVRPGVAVPSGGTTVSGSAVNGTAVNGTAGSAAGAPGVVRRVGPPSRPVVRGNPSQAPAGHDPARRRSFSRQIAGPEPRRQGATGTGRLALLAAFVIFAVYVLPYWGH